MVNYSAQVTIAGQAKIAAALANQGGPIVIAAVAAGDGNGAAIVPVVTMAGLVHEVWRGQPTAVSRDPASPTQVLVTFTIPSTAAPFTAREIGLFTSDGQLFVIASIPATDIVVQTQGATNSMDVTVPIVVDTAAQVTIVVDPAGLLPIAQMLRAPFIAIDSFVSTPPANPTVGELLVVNVAAINAFAGLDNQFVQWDGNQWLSCHAAQYTIIANSDGKYWQKLPDPGGWVLWGAQTVPYSTIYVRTDGNDAIADGSVNAPLKAFQTLAAADAFAGRFFSPAGAALTFQLGLPGEYPTPGTLGIPGISVTVQGDPNSQAAYIISGSRSVAGENAVVSARPNATLNVVGVTLKNNGSTLHTLGASSGAAVVARRVTFQHVMPTTAACACAFNGGSVTIQPGCIFGGSAAAMWMALSGTVIMAGDVTISAGAAYSIATVLAQNGTINMTVPTWRFLGATPTGARWIVTLNGVINTSGQGATYFPGTAAGYAATGGQYA